MEHPKPDTGALKVWDHASGVICVTESGGMVTDFIGAPLAFGEGRRTFEPAGRGVVVSNGSFHADLIEALASQRQRRGD